MKNLFSILLLIPILPLDASAVDTHTSNTQILNEVIVTGKKVTVEERGMDFTISNIQGSELADAGTMLDILSWAPGLSVDVNENIQVFGVSGSPLIYINGTKVTDMSKLTSLPSNIVKKIEVIRQPGAEYPTGTTSVLKITTTIPLRDITNATLIERATQRHRFSTQTTANSFGSIRKADILGSLKYKNGNGHQSAVATETIFSKGGSMLRDLTTHSDDRYHSHGWEWLAGATYHISSADDMQIEYSGGTSDRNRKFHNNRTILTSESTDNTAYDSQNKSASTNHTVLGSYNHEFRKSSINIQATYNYRDSHSDEDVFLLPLNTPYQTDHSHSRRTMWTAQGDYRWNCRKNDRHSVGIYGGRTAGNTTADYTITGNQDVASSVAWAEAYYSGYVEFGGWGITPGLRARFEKQKSHNTIRDEISDFDKSYFNIVPNISIYHRFSKRLAVNLFYKYDYDLPTFSQLSPTISLTDLTYYHTGNPDLKIPRTHNVALVFNLPKVTLIGEYRGERNQIVQTTSPIEGTDYFLVRPTNMSGNYRLTLQASYNLNVKNKFRMYANLLLCNSHVEYFYLDEIQRRNRFYTNISVNSSWTLHRNFSVFANVFYGSPRTVENLEVGYNCDISFGGNLKLLKSKLTLRLAVNDILARSVTPKWTSYSPNLIQTRRNYYDTRGVTLTATYRFTMVRQNYDELDNASDYDRF